MPLKKVARPAPVSFLLAEDAGLVTVVLSPDAPEDQARRICGPLGEGEVWTLENAPRVVLDASS